MQKEWFVVHTLTGQEQKVRDSLLHRIPFESMEEHIDQVVIPMENVSEIKKGVKTTVRKKFFPGYVLLHIALYDDQRKVRENSWHFIQDTPGVIRFMGGNKPTPLSEDEMGLILSQMEEKSEKARPKITFEPGESVKINDGPFLNFSGTVEEADPDRGKLKVSVAIFGRTAPVELEYWQVERME
jgi:transcription termination/antitermination protein NusG